jgi:hypothetical protein
MDLVGSNLELLCDAQTYECQIHNTLIMYIIISSQNIRPTKAYWTIELRETGRVGIGRLAPNIRSSFSQTLFPWRIP